MKEIPLGTTNEAPEIIAPAEEPKPSLMENLKGRAKDFIESAREKISSKASEWKDSIVETVKMNTVDKWQMMAANWNNNRLVGKKEKDISKQEARTEKLERKMQKQQDKHDNEKGKFDQALLNVNDTKLRDIFERSKTEKLAELGAVVAEKSGKVEEARNKGKALQGELDSFKEGVESAKTGFNGKIDATIGKIKEKNNYESSIKDRELLGKGITENQKLIESHEVRIAEYEGALQHKDLLSKEDLKGVRAELKNYKAELKRSENYVEQMQKAVARLDKHIASVEKKIGKWETFRGKYTTPAAPTETPPQPSYSSAETNEFIEKLETIKEISLNVGALEEALVTGSSSDKIRQVVGKVGSTLRGAGRHLEGDDAKAAEESLKIIASLEVPGGSNDIVLRKGSLMLLRKLSRFYQDEPTLSI